jgi:uncharacterized membrane protein YdjX (TVP38/TMEM64 family)
MGHPDWRILAVLILVVGIVAAWLLTPLGDWLSLGFIRECRVALAGMIEPRPLLCLCLFFAGCVVATSLCFPVAPIIGVSAGALFGFWPGLGIVLAASTIGSTIACLLSRSLLRNWARRQLAPRMARIERGFEAHGAAYLLALRFNPFIPYWLVNLGVGLTAMRMRAYVPLTALGLLPATFIYVQAGTRLAQIENGANIFTPGLLAILLLLCLVPLLVEAVRARFSASGSARA